MPIEFKLKPSSAALMAALSAVYPLTGQAASAGRVDFVIGDVKALAPDGRSRPLAKGADVENGETIDTGSGRAQVRFSDGAQVSLSPQSQFRIDDYKFAGKADGSEKGFFSLLRGAMRTITGVVGRSNRDNYKVSTTVATIGIRGTEYSVTYGNSISVTTGEGSIEVCNAAGCLILNSGESAHVPDSNTRPTMTDKKTEIPPPPAGDPLPQFIAGNSASGGFPVLPSGPGYSLAIAGHEFDGGEGYSLIKGPYWDSRYDGQSASTMANFNSSGALTHINSIDGGEGGSITAGVTVGALSDGVIGWGRWSSGNLDDNGYPTTLHNVHYVVGIPTPAADMSALQLASMIGTYSLIGFTYPTAYHSGTGVTIVGTQPISATLMANFGLGNVSGTLSVPIGGSTYSDSWSGGISGPNFNGSGAASIQGFFAGANASRAGLVYQFGGTPIGDISGAAAFKQTGLCVAGTGC
jgi:hypothetical protein